MNNLFRVKLIILLIVHHNFWFMNYLFLSCNVIYFSFLKRSVMSQSTVDMSQSSIIPKKRYRYIYDLPYDKRKILCNLLDMNDKWKELGGRYMEFDRFTLHNIGKAVCRRESPSDELLDEWGNQNHTIAELFILLRKMKHHQAMQILAPFVDSKYHKYVYEGRTQLSISMDENNFGQLNGDRNSRGAHRVVDELAENFKNNISVNQTSKRQADKNTLVAEARKNSERTTQRKLSDASNFIELESCIRFIKYDELEKATNFWIKDNKIGRGGFGVVYKGVMQETIVAIKRLEPQEGNEIEFKILESQKQSLFSELKHLVNSRHDNILPLYGYCVENERFCLVYQYMSNGSLEDRLQCRGPTAPLLWYQRYIIAVGTAKGLNFLHDREVPLVHGDIKSANILLDTHFEPKIGDFGLARDGPVAQDTHIKVSRVRGTRPYLPYEFLRDKKFSTKVDAYSFGVVLFEMATGLRAYDDKRSVRFLKDYIVSYEEDRLQDVVDKKAGPENPHLFRILIELGKKCVLEQPRERPEIKELLKQFNEYIRYNPIISPRRQSSWSLHYPQQWIFETPIISNQFPILRNRSPTNPSGPFPGLKQVPEGNSTDISFMKNSNSPNILVVPQNDINITTPRNSSNSPIVPDIKVIPPSHSTVNQELMLSESSVSDTTVSDSSTSFEKQSSDIPLCKNCKWSRRGVISAQPTNVGYGSDRKFYEKSNGPNRRFVAATVLEILACKVNFEILSKNCTYFRRTFEAYISRTNPADFAIVFLVKFPIFPILRIQYLIN